MAQPGDVATAARREAAKRLRSWSGAAVGFVLFLCAVFTLLTVITGFFLVLAAMTAVVYAFAAWVILRSYRPARSDVTYVAGLIDALQGEIVDARILDPPNEIPHGRAVLVLHDGLVVQHDRSLLRFLRLYATTGEPMRPSMREALIWTSATHAERYGRVTGPGPGSRVLSPELTRIATKWSLNEFGVSVLSPAEPWSGEETADRRKTPGKPHGSAALDIRGPRVPPAEVAAEAHAIRDLLDSLWTARAA